MSGALLHDKLREIFDVDDVSAVAAWLASTESATPVIVVGPAFSRFADDAQSRRPVTPVQVPLASDVRSTLRRTRATTGDDDESEGRKDPQPLEEAVAQVLVRRIDDAALAPAEAHEALFDCPAAAVLTTNRCDTLLDRGRSGWARVASEEEMGALWASNVPLIYLHGHRDAPSSWVTPGSLLAVEPSRPRMLAHARRLLGARPALFVGFEVDEADLSDVVALIRATDLAAPPRLLLLTEDHPRLPKRDWAERGIVAVVLRDPAPAAGVARVLRMVDPRGRGYADADEVQRIVASKRSFPERLHIVQDYLRDADRAPGGDDSVWRQCLRASFSDEDWQRTSRLHAADFEPSPTTSDLQPPAARVLARRTLSVLPDERFRRPSSLVWQLDALLANGGKPPRGSAADVARWLDLAIQQGIEATNHSLYDLVDLSSWVWRRALEEAPPAEQRALRDDAERAFRRAHALAVRYRFETAARNIAEDAAALGVALPVATQMPLGEVAEQPTPLTAALTRGLAALLDGRAADARQAYEEAIELSRAAPDPLAEWIATDGAHSALIADWSVGAWSDPERRRIRLGYWRRIEALEQRDPVRSWKARAEQRREAADAKTLERFQDREDARVLGKQSTRWDNVAHLLWRTLRDLESLGAAPGRQRTYLEPLIRLGVFDPDEELRQRLRFMLPATDGWLDRLLSDPRGTVEGRLALGDSLRRVMLEQCTTASERVALLTALPHLTDVLRVDDYEPLASFLEACKARWPVEAHTVSGKQYLFRDYPAAWCALACALPSPAILERLEVYRATIVHPLEAEAFGRCFDDLTWDAWVAEGVGVERLVAFALDTSASLADKAPRVSAGIAWALVAILHAGHESLPASARDRIEQWLLPATEAPDPDDRSWHHLPATAHIARALGEEPWRRTLAALLARLGGGAGDWRNSFERDAMIVEALLELGADESPVSGKVAELLARLERRWSEHRRFLELNPHHADETVRFLVAAARVLAEARVSCVSKLLEVANTNHRALRRIHPILEPTLWGADWPRLVECVRLAAGGGRGDHSNVSLASVLSLWSSSVEGGRELPPELRFLTEIGLVSVAHESRFVANQAAYGVVGYAGHLRTPEHEEPVASAMRRMAEDPRLVVRGAAAFGGSYLPRAAHSAAVRRTAEGIDAQLEDDPIAWIQRQRLRGRGLAVARGTCRGSARLG
ncbi:MAG: hypothetical protein HY744_01395 [Deltaproteobacteria bacterium]|nr:hypothetical protein [Deltaproteobacteria bacterium]